MQRVHAVPRAWKRCSAPPVVFCPAYLCVLRVFAPVYADKRPRLGALHPGSSAADGPRAGRSPGIHAGALRMNWRNILFIAILVLEIKSLVLGSAAIAAGVEQGAMAELAFTSTTAPVNCFDVQLQAIFTQGSAWYTFWGFYAGGANGVHTWKIRYNLPSTGTWRYTTISADRHLHRKTGWVTVTRPAPSNRGMLIADGRALKWQNTGELYYV